jgi:hypothetical protein
MRMMAGTQISISPPDRAAFLLWRTPFLLFAASERGDEQI